MNLWAYIKHTLKNSTLLSYISRIFPSAFNKMEVNAPVPQILKYVWLDQLDEHCVRAVEEEEFFLFPCFFLH